MSSPERWETIPEVVESARAAMAPPLWEFSGSGPEAEVTVRRNREVFDRYALVPRHLRSLSSREVGTTFLGHQLTMPVMLAPIGLIQTFHYEGALVCARAAERFGTICFIGTNAEPSLEQVRLGSKGPLIFQLYTYGDRPWIERMVRRVEQAGYDAICLTVDCPDFGLRDRYLSHDFEATRRSGGRPNVDNRANGDRDLTADQQRHLGEFTWDDLEWLRGATELPIIVKGLLSPLDAVQAVDIGADVVHVSNHGGRRQDQLPATIEVLPGIVDAVQGRVDVIVDGGVMRGTDVVKALALGAKAVLVGKLMIWALAAGGEEGIVRMLEILEREVRSTMANVGAAKVGDLTPDLVMPSFAPGISPWPVTPMNFRPV